MTSLPSRSALQDSNLDEYDAPFIRVADRIVTFSEWFLPEAKLAKALSTFCNFHELTFHILSKRSAINSIDGDYFEKCAGIERSAVITHEKGLGYQIADQFNYLITIDSTIGYEMLALGKRVGFISNRLRMIGVDSDELTFAQSLNWDKDGPFWTSAMTEEGILRFLAQFIDISEAEWSTYRETLVPNLMYLDPGNSVIRSHIRIVLSSSQ
jgi:surface carbohydrate biosynthesis protein